MKNASGYCCHYVTIVQTETIRVLGSILHAHTKNTTGKKSNGNQPIKPIFLEKLFALRLDSSKLVFGVVEVVV